MTQKRKAPAPGSNGGLNSKENNRIDYSGNAPQAPAAFTPYPQFILWRLEHRPGEPKPAKVPFDPRTGSRTNPHDPANWLSHDEAASFLAVYPDAGLGFVFTENDPFTFIDVDSCVQPDGTLTALATDIYSRFPGAAFEWSTSQTGFHLFVTGPVPEPFRKNNRQLHIECYTSKRFVALTGIGAQGDASIDHTAALAAFRDAYLATDGATIDDADWTDAPVPEWNGPTDDDELIALGCRMTSAASAFNGRATFADLWNGNEERLTDTYPSDTDVFGRSEADSALFSHLAFLTGKDCERMERIARRSALYRDKWERDDYRRNTILKAVARCENVYSKPDPAAITETEALDTARTFTRDTAGSEVSELLGRIASAGLSGISQEAILRTVKEFTGLSLGTLRRELNATAKDDEDLALLVAQRVENERFAGGRHILRDQFSTFNVYTGKYWVTKTDEQIGNIALGVIEASDDLGRASRPQLVKNVIHLLAVRNVVQSDVMGLTSEPRPLINCDNGELHFDENGGVAFYNHTAESYLRYVLQVPYTPGAQADRLDAILLGIFANATDPAGMVRHIYEVIGYAIQPDRFIPAFFIWQGQGRNGKSLLTGLIEALMSPAAVHSGSMSELQNNRFAIGYLLGKLILLDDDVTTGQRLPDGLLKKISERKLLTGERKNKDPFEFVATVLPIMLTNNFPTVSDLSPGLRRRAYVVPFSRIFTDEDADPNLLSTICATELPALLNRAIEGFQRLRARGRFEEPVDCVVAKQAWLEEANPLPAFLNEKCTLGDGHSVLISDFYRHFQTWALQNGYRSVPIQKVVKRDLKNMGFGEHRYSSGIHIMGCTVGTPLTH